MMSFRIVSKTSGADLGTYEGDTAAHALAAMHRDAGYKADVVGGELVSDAPGSAADLAVWEITG